MTFAYLILAHKKNPVQLMRMMKALNVDGVNFYIHIDLKSDEKPFREMISGKNIFFCKRRIAVHWGGYSMIEATMELIKAMSKQNGFPDYVHLLSGQDFPIKTNENIFDYFKQNKSLNFIEYRSLPCSNWSTGGMNRILYEWQMDKLGFRKSAELVSLQKPRPFLQGYQPYGGSQWWSLTGKCVEFILNSYLKGGDFFEFYKHTLCPDEMLFQTFLIHSNYKETLINNNLRKIEWSYKGEYPKIWKKDDFYEFIATPELFARKFDETIDQTIIEKVEKRSSDKQAYLPSNTSYPLVSIVMPAYNVEKYIKESIDSILTQTFDNFELIIVDDGSDDNTVKMIKSYDDRRIRLIEMPHNFVNSLNTGINAARGKYIARMDADDIMIPERLEVQVEYMETHREIDACGSFANYTAWSNDLISVPLNHIDIACAMFTTNAIIHPSSIIRKKSLLHIRYNNDYLYAEDYKFWTDLIMQGCKLANIPYSLMKYRCSESQVTRIHNHEMSLVSERIKREYLDYAINKLCAVGEDVADYISKLHNMVLQKELRSGNMLEIIIKMYKNLLRNE